MDIHQIIDLINNIGFPMGVCITLFWFIKVEVDKVLNLFIDFKDVISNNTLSIKLLISKLEGSNDVSSKK